MIADNLQEIKLGGTSTLLLLGEQGRVAVVIIDHSTRIDTVILPLVSALSPR